MLAANPLTSATATLPRQGRTARSREHLTRPRDARQLFVEHAAFVASFLRRLGVPERDVDDGVQEVFLVAHRKGGYQPGPATPRTWLGAIAVRVGAALARKSRGREQPAGESDALERHPSRSPGPHAAAEIGQALTRVQAALDTLDLDHRSVFVLYELDGERCADIASSLGLPVGTVYSRLHTARGRFLEAYRDLNRPPESSSAGPDTHHSDAASESEEGTDEH